MISRMGFESVNTEAGTRESFAGLLVELASQSSLLVREEVMLARRELREDFEHVRSAYLKVALGIAGAVLAALSLLTAAILALSQYWQPWQAALAVGLGLAVVAGAIIVTGLAQTKQARMRPEQTIETIEETKQWLEEIT